MRCFHPIHAHQLADGSVKFFQKGSSGHHRKALFSFSAGPVRDLYLRCGQCIGCRLARSEAWALRCVHEASLYDANAFLTLTYRDVSLPAGGSLDYRHFQLFMKRLRKHFAPQKIRFYMCGEYGPKLGRPHFHACVFNCGFADRVPFKKVSTGMLYRSPTLERLWPHGHSSIGDVTYESAAYVARYVCEKITGDEAPGWYQRIDEETGEIHDLVPEFCRMSLRPGLGQDWMRLYWRDVEGGKAVAQGKEKTLPKYYERMLRRLESYEDLEYRRAVQARLCSGEATDERLAVAEQVAKARLNVGKRKLGG